MTKPDPAKAEQLDAALARAAEALGDLTAPAMALFYARHPEALAAFEHHGLGKRERLEAEMVDTALYCLMTWLERPAEVAIMLYGSVPHHQNTLHVRPEWYRGLLGSVIDIVAATVPPEATDERGVLEYIREGLLEAIAESLEELPVRIQATA